MSFVVGAGDEDRVVVHWWWCVVDGSGDCVVCFGGVYVDEAISVLFLFLLKVMVCCCCSCCVCYCCWS